MRGNDGHLAVVHHLRAGFCKVGEITWEQMFLLPERAQPAPQVHELSVKSRQLSGALRFGLQSGHVGRADCWAQ